MPLLTGGDVLQLLDSTAQTIKLTGNVMICSQGNAWYALVTLIFSYNEKINNKQM